MASLQAVGTPVVAKEMTLNERLNRANGAIDNELAIIERMLGRVNDIGQDVASGSAPTPVFGLAMVVDRIEGQAKRLAELVQGIERIA